MAVKDDSFISKLIMVDPFGVKIGGPLDRDIQDIWTLHPNKVIELKYHDTDFGKRDYSSVPEEEVTIAARNIESFARFCWEPYMHNPKLKVRLPRIKVPTLVIWGENDGVASTAYGKAYAENIPGAKFVTVPKAGHYPHIEQAQAVLAGRPVKHLGPVDPVVQAALSALGHRGPCDSVDYQTATEQGDPRADCLLVGGSRLFVALHVPPAPDYGPMVAVALYVAACVAVCVWCGWQGAVGFVLLSAGSLWAAFMWTTYRMFGTVPSLLLLIRQGCPW